jgi:redox-sensitive bicupin YhaK (pirin superfamily)
VHLVSGNWGGEQGAIESLTGVFMTWVELAAGGSVTFDGLRGRDVFLYGARGGFEVSGIPVPQFTLAELGEGNTVTLTASEPALLLFGHAEPIPEPIVSHGPFVMNSVEEIRQAFADYQAGMFGTAEIVKG